MNNMLQNQGSDYNKSEKIVRSRYPVPATLVVALVLFFLPFAEIRCMDYKIASNSGVGLALGTEWKSELFGSMRDLMKENGKMSEQDAKKQLKDSPKIPALLSIAAALAAIGFACSENRVRLKIVTWLAVIALLAHIGLLIQLRWELTHSGKDGEGLGAGIDNKLFGIRFTIWYYLSGLLFAGAAVLNIARGKLLQKEEQFASPVFDFQVQEDAAPLSAEENG